MYKLPYLKNRRQMKNYRKIPWKILCFFSLYSKRQIAIPEILWDKDLENTFMEIKILSKEFAIIKSNNGNFYTLFRRIFCFSFDGE